MRPSEYYLTLPSTIHLQISLCPIATEALAGAAPISAHASNWTMRTEYRFRFGSCVRLIFVFLVPERVISSASQEYRAAGYKPLCKKDRQIPHSLRLPPSRFNLQRWYPLRLQLAAAFFGAILACETSQIHFIWNALAVRQGRFSLHNSPSRSDLKIILASFHQPCALSLIIDGVTLAASMTSRILSTQSGLSWRSLGCSTILGLIDISS
jgi:hypothetical protein